MKRAGAVVVALAFGAYWSYLAIERHNSFNTNAFDLGYITQTLWYTAHGQLFRFTTLEGVPFSPEGTLDPTQLHRPYSLLAFHVEPLLLAVAPVFAIWPDARLLLAIQGFGLAAGALAAAALARRRLGNDLAAAVFGLAYLVSPSIAAAALSDFHAVALGASLLMATLYFLASGHRRLALAAALLAAAAREDAAIVVACLGGYLWLRSFLANRKYRGNASSAGSGREGVVHGHPDILDSYAWAGRALVVGVGAWVVLAFGLITPFFNGTVHALLNHAPGNGSIFWHRYAWLGASPISAFRNLVTDPGPLLRWFGDRDVVAYVGTLVLSGGGVALLAPDALLIGLPILLENTLSSFGWMRSGGAHYSTMLVPIFVFAGIEGARRLVTLLGRAAVMPKSFAILPLVVVLGASAANHVWLGASPVVTPSESWSAPGPHQAAVDEIMSRIPPNASISATSAVYPHLATRAKAYWFPAVQDADYVAVDVSASTDPVAPSDIRAQVSRLLVSGRYGVDAAAPGFVLLRRGGDDDRLPSTLADFAKASDSEQSEATKIPGVRFGHGLMLDGYSLRHLPTLTVFGPTLQLTTFWHVEQPLPSDVSFVFYPTRKSDGAIIGAARDQGAAAIWYPPTSWLPGETVMLTSRFENERDIQAIGVAAVDIQSGEPRLVESSGSTVIWNNRTIARVVRLDGVD